MKEPFNSSKPKNRADEIALPKSDNFSVTLYDVDLAIMEYMRDVVLPELEEDKKKIEELREIVDESDEVEDLRELAKQLNSGSEE